jgi:hypothetical protein
MAQDRRSGLLNVYAAAGTGGPSPGGGLFSLALMVIVGYLIYRGVSRRFRARSGQGSGSAPVHRETMQEAQRRIETVADSVRGALSKPDSSSVTLTYPHNDPAYVDIFSRTLGPAYRVQHQPHDASAPPSPLNPPGGLLQISRSEARSSG